MKKPAVVVTVAVLLSFASLALAADTGADVYKTKCAACHGADGAGAMATKMGSKPLGSADVQGMSDADLTALITNGKGKMPGYKGKLADAQIKAVVQHVRTLKK